MKFATVKFGVCEDRTMVAVIVGETPTKYQGYKYSASTTCFLSNYENGKFGTFPKDAVLSWFPDQESFITDAVARSAKGVYGGLSPRRQSELGNDLGGAIDEIKRLMSLSVIKIKNPV